MLIPWRVFLTEHMGNHGKHGGPAIVSPNHRRYVDNWRPASERREVRDAKPPEVRTKGEGNEWIHLFNEKVATGKEWEIPLLSGKSWKIQVGEIL